MIIETRITLNIINIIEPLDGFRVQFRKMNEVSRRYCYMMSFSIIVNVGSEAVREASEWPI